MININQLFNDAVNAAVDARITELMQQHANIVADLAVKIEALEKRESAAIDAVAGVEALNTQEWFWQKINDYVEKHVNEAVESAVNDMIDSKIEAHELDKDHQSEDDIDDKIRDSLKNALRDALDNL